MDKYLRKNSGIATSLGKMSGSSKEKIKHNFQVLPKDLLLIYIIVVILCIVI